MELSGIGWNWLKQAQAMDHWCSRRGWRRRRRSIGAVDAERRSSRLNELRGTLSPLVSWPLAASARLFAGPLEAMRREVPSQ